MIHAHEDKFVKKDKKILFIYNFKSFKKKIEIVYVHYKRVHCYSLVSHWFNKILCLNNPTLKAQSFFKSKWTEAYLKIKRGKKLEVDQIILGIKT